MNGRTTIDHRWMATHGSAGDGRTTVMFEEMQHSIVGQHMADLTREATEARTARQLRAAASRPVPTIRERLGAALMRARRVLGGRARPAATTDPVRSQAVREPCPEPARRDVARAA